jgi:hypothetical protein
MKIVFWLAMVLWAFSLGIGCGPPPPQPPGPTIKGIAPSEAKEGEDVYIEGVGFAAAGPITLTLVDVVSGAETPVPANDIKWIEDNRIKVRTKPPNLVGRRLYRLKMNTGYLANAASDRVYYRENEQTRPPGEFISVQYIQWRPGWGCNYRNTAGALGPPYICGCNIIDFLPLPMVQNGSIEFNPNDAWTAPRWDDFFEQAQDASREWMSFCSEAWRGPGPPPAWLRGIKEETDQRVTLYSAGFYFLPVDVDAPYVGALARRKWVNSIGTAILAADFCIDRPFDNVEVPPDCTVWKPNQTSPLTVNVHLIGAFYRNGAELDPATTFRGYANPTSGFVNTDGMIVMTDNPRLGARRKIPFFSPECWGLEYSSATSALNVGYWDAARFESAVPNLFSHELHHVLTGYVHASQDPCGTVAVGVSTSPCPRGFKMGLSATQTVQNECAWVTNGPYTR